MGTPSAASIVGPGLRSGTAHATLPAHLDAGGIEAGELRFRGLSELEVVCNWKIAVENYLGCYHPGLVREARA